jgi:hypothetical protein
MSLQARICDLADAVVQTIAENWAPVAPDAVQRVWVADLCCNVDEPDRLIQGRQVYVLPVTHATPEWWDRAEKRNVYTLAVLVAQRYTGPDWPPNSFVDPIVQWGEQQVFYPLSNPGLVLTGPAGIVTKAYPAPDDMPEIPVLVDRERYVQNKLVLSQYTLAFQDATSYTGG